MSLLAPVTIRVHDVVRKVGGEVTRFAVVGALAFVLDNGGYTLLVFGLPGRAGGVLDSWPVLASVVATTVATLFSWAGNRYWTYRHQRRDNVAHELGLFILVNAVGIAVTAGTVSFSREVLGQDSIASDNLARILGWVIATALRFVAYRRYVFVATSS